MLFIDYLSRNLYRKHQPTIQEDNLVLENRIKKFMFTLDDEIGKHTISTNQNNPSVETQQTDYAKNSTNQTSDFPPAFCLNLRTTQLPHK